MEFPLKYRVICDLNSEWAFKLMTNYDKKNPPDHSATKSTHYCLYLESSRFFGVRLTFSFHDYICFAKYLK